jgi:hypothetical protein
MNKHFLCLIATFFDAVPRSGAHLRLLQIDKQAPLD